MGLTSGLPLEADFLICFLKTVSTHEPWQGDPPVSALTIVTQKSRVISALDWEIRDQIMKRNWHPPDALKWQRQPELMMSTFGELCQVISRLRKQEFKLKSLSHQTRHLTIIFKLINPQKCPHKINNIFLKTIKITQWNIYLNNSAIITMHLPFVVTNRNFPLHSFTKTLIFPWNSILQY